ncbi:centrosome-associated protein 350 [Neolamprologus brichardi]|uniref:centrosome-associated protein 350 n=1 Tax=Neolamprologus brichardi TaxID=32507 RepID=UPI0016437674|nr:centrosome-associated protein 350 [Neolamprologus brichardi]
MRSSRRTEASLKSSAQHLSDHNVGTELTAAWKSLAQSKVALRHIENRIQAAPGTGVILDSVIDSNKKKSSRAHHRDGRQVDDIRGSSKPRGRSQQSPEKSSSRSPLRNTTQDRNVRRNNSVEFREPLASYREATPPPHPSSQPEAYSQKSVPASLSPSSPPHSDSLPSQLVYQKHTTDKEADKDLDSTRSSGRESTEVRYLNDQPALDSIRTKESSPKAQVGMDSQQSSPCIASTPGSFRQEDSTPSTSPGSASQRLENLRRHQPDNKLEKLKERIRRQRQHLEEAAEREKLMGNLEQPLAAFVETNDAGTSNKPTAKIRKVAAAPPAPIYKGFNSTETKIRTPDGKVWKEEDFHNLSRELYRDLSKQFAESTRHRHQQQREQRADRSKERRPPKTIRKVHRAAPASDLNPKPAISPASWREGQKLVKMVLGPVPQLPREEDSPHAADLLSRTDSRHRSDLRSESKRRSRPNSTERPCSGFQGQSQSHLTPTSIPQDKVPGGLSSDLLSADIQGILDDLQLECKAAERDERARKRSRGSSSGRRGGSGSRTRTPVSTWGTTAAANSSSRACRSASPTTHRPETTNITDAKHKKRHYDADTVRQYIARQQEERKRRQADEKKAMREESERRHQRLQELYRKQREVARTVAIPTETPVAPVQKRLQETYNKLLMEEAQLGEGAMQTLPAVPSTQLRPMYQPSGESDKENKRLEAPQSPSSSDRSLNDHPPPPLTRVDLDLGVAPLPHQERLYPPARPLTGPSSTAQGSDDDRLFSQLLRIEAEVAASNSMKTPRPATAPSGRSRSKMSRIEAIKATAASLSNRIESEARKLAGEGINYGNATSMDMDTVLVPRPSVVVDGWAGTAARDTEKDNMALRIQKILTTTNYSSYNGTALPGAGSLHSFREQKLKNGKQTSVDVIDPIFNSYTQERGKLVNGLEKESRMNKISERKQITDEGENRTDLHDSSGGSISEGPLLSEGSFSEDEQSPPRPSRYNYVPRPADRLEAADYCARQRKDYQRLMEFQREAEKCSGLGLSFAQQDRDNAVWEELNKGSPLSVINIFTKNHHSHIKVSDRNVERNSPSAHSAASGNGPGDAAVYEDDFVSSHSSKASGQIKRSSNSPSVNNHFEELMRRSPYEKSTDCSHSHHSSFQSSNHSQHLSSGSTPASSPLSRHSARKRGTVSDQSDNTLVEEQRSSCSPPSEALSSESRKGGSDKNSSHTQAKSVHSNDTLGEASGHSHQQSRLVSSTSSPIPRSPPTVESPNELLRNASNQNTGTKSTGELQYSPGVLQQRMAAELHYLDSIEESFRQLGDVERLMGVSMAQQESASLAQMLKAKQQRHERELYELKIKAEREALETKLQLEENRQRVARAHIELQETLAASQKKTLGGLQESTTKMMTQQAEAAQYTADAARHIKEMTELVRSQMSGSVVVPPVATDSSTVEQRKENDTYSMEHRQDNVDSDSFQSEPSNRRTRSEEPLSSLSASHSDSLSFRKPNLSGSALSSQHSPSHHLSNHEKQMKKEAIEGKWRNSGLEKRPKQEAASSSIEEEVLAAAANDSICSDSIPSVIDEKGDSTSVATEYSLKFDESMTEDEIEERSFRSLLPSEAHRRGTMEKKSRHHEESEDDGANHSALVSGPGLHNSFKSQDSNIAFSGGQDSFSQFTMDMVRQYMKDEEVRLQHQSSLLRLRQKALKEKTRTELAWLEHLKKKLRDKGEDDKMPPIRKKQRGLLLKLQQEQAEIRRLQEANKAARKERQLLLKQQEEIERMRNSTLRLKERLKCAGIEAPPETPVSETPGSEPASPDMRHADDNRSPSPSLSVSGSETSSIMQKLKKMRSHMDEKHCSPVHCFFSVFTAHHWASLSVCLPNLHPKFRLFIYNQLVRYCTVFSTYAPSPALPCLDSTPTPWNMLVFVHWHWDLEDVSEGDCSSVTPESSIHTEGPAPPASVSEITLASVQGGPANYTQDFTSASQSPTSQLHSNAPEGSHSPAASPSEGSSKTKMQLRSTSRTLIRPCTQPTDPPMATQSETISDQSDIESRIKALKEELKKRKLMASQLKKEQKKRHKERLKAEEASLLKQLENYNNFIEKTKADLNKEPDLTLDTNSQINESNSVLEHLPSSHRSELVKISESERTQIDASLDHHAFPKPHLSRSTSVPGDVSAETPQRVTPGVAISGSPESPTSGQSNHQSTEDLIRQHSTEDKSEYADENIVSDYRSDIQEELEVEISSRVEDEQTQHLLKLENEDRLDSRERLPTSKCVSSSVDEEQQHSSTVGLEQGNQMKQSEVSDVEEPLQPYVIASSQPHSAVADLKTSAHQNYGSASVDQSPSPNSDAFGSMKEASIKDTEASPVADGYHDDFESSVDSSSKEEHHSSKAESQTSHVSSHEIKGSRKDASSRGLAFDSTDEVVEEEIAEDLSHHSGISVPSHKSGRLLDLNKQAVDFKRDNESFDSRHSPTIYSLQVPLSPVIDEMPDFYIGDRVLVGGVQPGTLRFKGPTSFANGFWAGVELDKSEGSNNGTYDGVVYFECDERHGIFAPPDKITHLPDKFELYTDTTEDEDSFFDDLSDKDRNEPKTKEDNFQMQENLNRENEQTSQKETGSNDKKETDGSWWSVLKASVSETFESPVLGAIGQEELAKRLAELELSRELLDDLGDDQDWFDEDFGLSSRRKQQKLKEEEARLGAGFGRSSSSAGPAVGEMGSSSGGEPQVKTPPRPELPLPLPPKLPEQPAMVVPHSAVEVEKMVHAATRELWDSFDLGNKGTLTHGQLPSPQPSLEYLGKEDSTQNQESLSIRSYRKAVYDLTWEILQEIYAEDPNTNQPQWVKPRRVKSSSFHKVRTPGDVKKIQEFITEEVLKLYGLTKDQNQKNDWQKMLKFGRKKRDRVDHILVQELHEEEAQWVNYDEDELFVKMQLADSIFDSLLKDTVNVLTLISDRRANRDTLS